MSEYPGWYKELKKKILDIIYGADWYFGLGGGPGAEYYEVDEYFIEDEDEVVMKLINEIKAPKKITNILRKGHGATDIVKILGIEFVASRFPGGTLTLIPKGRWRFSMCASEPKQGVLFLSKER